MKLWLFVVAIVVHTEARRAACLKWTSVVRCRDQGRRLLADCRSRFLHGLSVFHPVTLLYHKTCETREFAGESGQIQVILVLFSRAHTK